jgi:hypothetical protein
MKLATRYYGSDETPRATHKRSVTFQDPLATVCTFTENDRPDVIARKEVQRESIGRLKYMLRKLVVEGMRQSKTTYVLVLE